MFTCSIPNTLNQGVPNKTSYPVPMPHHIYFDNDIYLTITNRAHLEQATATSIEANSYYLGHQTYSTAKTPYPGTNSSKCLSPQ